MWGAIKKAINSNLSKSLDVLIQEKTTEINAKVDGVNAEVDTKASQASISTLQSTANTIKSTIDTINQNLGFQNRSKVFTSNGTFTVPSGIETIYITATAAGGDGGDTFLSVYWNKLFTSGGGGGASGESVTRYRMDVTPNSEIPIIVGIGNTVINNLVLTKGGNGTIGSNTSADGNSVAGKGGIGGVLNGVNGGNALVNSGADKVVGAGGHGGYSRMGLLDTEMNTPTEVSVYCGALGSPLPNTGGVIGTTATKYGCGGGGAGGATGSANTTIKGGKGAPGIVIIEW